VKGLGKFMIPNVHLFTVTRATPLFDVFFNRQVIFTGKCRRVVIEGPVINFEKYFFNAYFTLKYLHSNLFYSINIL
jgi:hypothetical protein